MAKNEPKLTFLFPIRWLEDPEDRKFFGENIYRTIKKEVGEEGMEQLATIPMYRVEIMVQYKEPIKLPITQNQIEKLLKKVFVYGRCVGFQARYQEHISRTMLPLLDFRVYF